MLRKLLLASLVVIAIALTLMPTAWAHLLVIASIISIVLLAPNV